MIAPQDGKGRSSQVASSPAPASTESPPGRPTARRSPTSTTRRRSSGSTWRPASRRRSAATTSTARQKTLIPPGRPTRSGSPTPSTTRRCIQTVFVYSLEQDKSLRPSPTASSDATEPVFDRSGKYLYLLRLDRRRARCSNWFAPVERRTCDVTRSIYLAVLRKDLPLAAREGERRGEAEEGRAPAEKAGDKPDAAAEKKADAEKEEPVANRLRRDRAPDPRPARSPPAISPPSRRATPGRSSTCAATAGTRAPALRPDEAQDRDAARVGRRLRDLGGREEAALRQGQRLRRHGDGPKIEPGEGRIAAAEIEVRIDPRAEWRADLRGGLADQPRLLLRPEHARRRLDGA